jgi:hypothetical protein
MKLKNEENDERSRGRMLGFDLPPLGPMCNTLSLPTRISCATPDLLLKHPNATLATFL